MTELSLTAADFERITVERRVQTIARPSLSYWRDAWVRLKTNRRALASLYIVIALLLFTVVGPWVWTVDPTAQDLDQLSTPPGADRRAQIVEPYVPWNGVFTAINEPPPKQSEQQLQFGLQNQRAPKPFGSSGPPSLGRAAIVFIAMSTTRHQMTRSVCR